MVRTRDFVLFLLVVAVLLLAIVGTELWQMTKASVLDGWWGTTTEERDYTAEVPVVEDTRESKLASLREKVAERLSLKSAEPAPEEVEEPPVETTAATTTTTAEVAEVTKCPAYRERQIAWVPQAISQENREGVRVYFEPGIPDPLSSTTPETIRAIIPLRSWPGANPNCLPSDIVGVAIDGSLIRNDELALYTVFGGDTLIGYSLDGFPIYGQSSVKTDTCGGAIVGGTYRYIVDDTRAGIINCFAGEPASIN